MNHHNGYRDQPWDTRAGTVELALTLTPGRSKSIEVLPFMFRGSFYWLASRTTSIEESRA